MHSKEVKDAVSWARCCSEGDWGRSEAVEMHDSLVFVGDVERGGAGKLKRPRPLGEYSMSGSVSVWNEVVLDAALVEESKDPALETRRPCRGKSMEKIDIGEEGEADNVGEAVSGLGGVRAAMAAM